MNKFFAALITCAMAGSACAADNAEPQSSAASGAQGETSTTRPDRKADNADARSRKRETNVKSAKVRAQTDTDAAAGSGSAQSGKDRPDPDKSGSAPK